jgi:hypothetical protein
MLYYDGVYVLITGACMLLLLGVVKSLYPESFEPMKITIMSGGSRLEVFRKHINDMVEVGNLAGLVILTGLSFLPMTAKWIWTYIGWGAFRELNLASKRASAITFIVFFVLHSASLPLLFFIASTLGSSYEQ